MKKLFVLWNWIGVLKIQALTQLFIDTYAGFIETSHAGFVETNKSCRSFLAKLLKILKIASATKR